MTKRKARKHSKHAKRSKNPKPCSKPISQTPARVLATVSPYEDRPDHGDAVFPLNDVTDPLVGTPSEVRKELNALAMHLQRHPDDDIAFSKIHAYIHRYLTTLVRRY